MTLATRDRTIFKGNTVDGTGTVWDSAHGSASLIDVNASGVLIDSNTIQFGSPNAVTFFEPFTYEMAGTIASNNHIDLQNITLATVSFYGFNFTGNTTQDGRVVIKCNNTVTNGAFSNVDCSP